MPGVLLTYGGAYPRGPDHTGRGCCCAWLTIATVGSTRSCRLRSRLSVAPAAGYAASPLITTYPLTIRNHSARTISNLGPPTLNYARTSATWHLLTRAATKRAAIEPLLSVWASYPGSGDRCRPLAQKLACRPSLRGRGVQISANPPGDPSWPAGVIPPRQTVGGRARACGK